ncbi:SRPBCC family protein [Sediminibacterium soli]|uniref:hypothetical protein n=1 Tax=Sediminibacterium soli TaxID=2698829 RepID=UPI00137AEBAD|nr:hypothetical protein [Sediminibacterium soli]NCI45969.1 hypothetical protein [Sediminibacterium soli]
MRFLRLILISIALLFIIATLIGALLPSVVLVSRAVNITAPRDSVLPYVKDIHGWKHWIEGMDGPSVHIQSPVQAQLGNTAVTILSVTDSTVVADWLPAKGAPQTATMRLISSADKKITVVQWQFEQKLHWYPWERLGSMMNDKILGTMMERNLGKLNSVITSPR